MSNVSEKYTPKNLTPKLIEELRKDYFNLLNEMRLDSNGNPVQIEGKNGRLYEAELLSPSDFEKEVRSILDPLTLLGAYEGLLSIRQRTATALAELKK
jgi:hypothetical protein